MNLEIFQEKKKKEKTIFAVKKSLLETMGHFHEVLIFHQKTKKGKKISEDKKKKKKAEAAAAEHTEINCEIGVEMK